MMENFFYYIFLQCQRSNNKPYSRTNALLGTQCNCKTCNTQNCVQVVYYNIGHNQVSYKMQELIALRRCLVGSVLLIVVVVGFFCVFLPNVASLSGLSIFSSPCQRQCELLPSLGVCRPLTFHIR
jgi:hypothetical protein